MTVAAILLAAARADIDGTPLSLMPWDGDETVIEHEVEQLLAGGAGTVVVVLGDEAERILPYLARGNVEPIVHGAWASDAAGAIRTGAAATPRDASAAVVIDVTRPRPARLCEALLDAHFASVAAITRPARAGVPDWPVVVDEHVLAELRNVSDAGGGIEALLARHAVETQVVPFEDDVAVLCIDGRAAYERALRDDT